MTETILITGGKGFLGRHLRQELNKYKLNADIIAVGSKEYELTSREGAMMLFERYQPDIVIHLAAMAGGIGFNKKHPADVIQINSAINYNIFNAITKYRPKYFYGAGSVCEYPLNCPTPFKEDNLWNGFPEKTNSGYGQCKRTLLLQQQAFREQYGLKGAHFLIVNLFGPHDSFNSENSHVIGALIHKFVDAVKNNKKIVECWGTGQAYREFFYVEDCARAFAMAAVTKLDTDLPINLGTGKTISIYELAHLIGKLTGFTGEIIFTGDVSDGQPKRQLDVSRAREFFGFTANIDLENGLKRTIEWYKENI